MSASAEITLTPGDEQAGFRGENTAEAMREDSIRNFESMTNRAFARRTANILNLELRNRA